MGCTTISIESGDSNCSKGALYQRLPFENCIPGYEHPRNWDDGGGNCYCLADPEAKALLDKANAGEFGDIFTLLKKYWYIVAAILILYLLPRR